MPVEIPKAKSRQPSRNIPTNSRNYYPINTEAAGARISSPYGSYLNCFLKVNILPARFYGLPLTSERFENLIG